MLLSLRTIGCFASVSLFLVSAVVGQTDDAATPKPCVPNPLKGKTCPKVTEAPVTTTAPVGDDTATATTAPETTTEAPETTPDTGDDGTPSTEAPDDTTASAPPETTESPDATATDPEDDTTTTGAPDDTTASAPPETTDSPDATATDPEDGTATTEAPDDTAVTEAPGDGEDGEYKCWSNITAIYYDLVEKKAFSFNTYHICPGIYDIGYQYGRGNCCENGYYPIVTRSNTHFKCGKDGSSQNGCIFRKGTSHVLINDVIFDEEITGCTIQGFTFRSPTRTTSFSAAAGDVTFTDCIFEDQQNEGPILAIHDNGIRSLKKAYVDNDPDIDPIGFAMSQEMLDLHERHAENRQLEEIRGRKEGGSTRSLQKKETLADLMTLIFDQCIFRNCTQFPPVDDIPTFGILSGRSPDNIFEIWDCIFVDNEYTGEGIGDIGYAISVHEGSDAKIYNTCFLNNDFNGWGTVEVFEGGLYESENNYGDVDPDVRCQFIAYSETQPQSPEEVRCIDYEATSCQASIYGTEADVIETEPPIETEAPGVGGGDTTPGVTPVAENGDTASGGGSQTPAKSPGGDTDSDEDEDGGEDGSSAAASVTSWMTSCVAGWVCVMVSLNYLP